MRSFVHSAQPGRVIFGRGSTDQVADEAEHLGITRALVLTTPQQTDLGDLLAEKLGAVCVGQFNRATMHTPVDVTLDALDLFNAAEADGVVAIGGGSTTGLGKAIALRTDCQQLVLPTTYAGSEMTALLGQTENGRKTTLRDLRVLPETVIYDADHTLSLPLDMTVTSAMNAAAHAVEALYAPGATPVLNLIAEEGMKRLADAIPRIAADPSDPDARDDALLGAWLCATCLGNGGIALHHKLCHVLGGAFALPHAEIHTALLPHALAYNACAVPEAIEALRRATGSNDPAAALFDLPARAGATMALRDLGMPEHLVERAVDMTLEAPYPNPRPLDPTALKATLLAAWAGERPHV